ncbi:hypothetical protein L484_009895 [Morus notabilis]|uniref:Uncharacterized protein n=1 Tax=Morus notabilis TaxID=981085 RepID=W9RZE9_9ROSA|nr:hypothetical protein L484_009895 [Morus notabilis]
MVSPSPKRLPFISRKPRMRSDFELPFDDDYDDIADDDQIGSDIGDNISDPKVENDMDFAEDDVQDQDDHVSYNDHTDNDYDGLDLVDDSDLSGLETIGTHIPLCKCKRPAIPVMLDYIRLQSIRRTAYVNELLLDEDEEIIANEEIVPDDVIVIYGHEDGDIADDEIVYISDDEDEDVANEEIVYISDDDDDDEIVYISDDEDEDITSNQIVPDVYEIADDGDSFGNMDVDHEDFQEDHSV